MLIIYIWKTWKLIKKPSHCVYPPGDAGRAIETVKAS